MLGGEYRLIDDPSRPVGLYRDTRPEICEVSLTPGLVAVVYSDGLIHSGDRTGQSLNVVACMKTLLQEGEHSPKEIADFLLETAVEMDQGRPVDDITVVVLQVTSLKGDAVRRLSVRLPLDS
jgi:serine phosphatase RsbU (regulator of sigma subunit)